MLSGKILLCVVILAALRPSQSASLPPLIPFQVGDDNEVRHTPPEIRIPVELMRARVREGVPLPLCVGRCVSPPTGPVCAFDATGTARTFSTLCDLEAASCRESTYYAITNLGEC